MDQIPGNGMANFLLAKKQLKRFCGKAHFDSLEKNTWIDIVSDKAFDQNSLLEHIGFQYPELVTEFQSNEALELPKSKIPSIYFIREQRLLRPVSNDKIRSWKNLSMLASIESEIDGEVSAFSQTIEEYAKELRENIKETLAKSSQINQELDSSFPRRLFDQQLDISEQEFTQRFDKVKDIQKALSEFGLSDVKEDNHPTYKKENAKALCVYIEDTERKLAVFSSLLEKLKAFTEILNERRFTFKRIDISKDHGFKFSTHQGTELALTDLSSGEQQEVVILYELLFKVRPGTLVLIDEPELSLHVVWQKQFLDDLFKIIELQKINIIIATHSPQIVNEHWELTVDLEELQDAALSQ
ncbi:AAA family ATPase [Methylocucumis oryzae]|uniref:AAA family ATPase n=1 Tax=Methylocucumis oryzae TaxID=1632867 RepID=UPI0006962D51|nr:AAA family ATPase [Methylocucumis oryzae]